MRWNYRYVCVYDEDVDSHFCSGNQRHGLLLLLLEHWLVIRSVREHDFWPSLPQ
jgi:hypothetical protein